MIQDLSTSKPGKWTKTGQIVEVEPYDSYLVKDDGSGHVAKRNRRFLRKIIPYIERAAGNDQHVLPPSAAHVPRSPSPSALLKSTAPPPSAVTAPSSSLPYPPDPTLPLPPPIDVTPTPGSGEKTK